MFKNINSEKYSKSILDVDYWKYRKFEEEMKVFYKEENKKLKAEIERLERLLDNEHNCDKNCFAEHVLPAIQSDYEKYNNSSHLIQHKFIEHWSDKLYDEYDFVSCICLVNDKITVKYK